MRAPPEGHTSHGHPRARAPPPSAPTSAGSRVPQPKPRPGPLEEQTRDDQLGRLGREAHRACELRTEAIPGALGPAGQRLRPASARLRPCRPAPHERQRGERSAGPRSPGSASPPLRRARSDSSSSPTVPERGFRNPASAQRNSSSGTPAPRTRRGTQTKHFASRPALCVLPGAPKRFREKSPVVNLRRNGKRRRRKKACAPTQKPFTTCVMRRSTPRLASAMASAQLTPKLKAPPYISGSFRSRGSSLLETLREAERDPTAVDPRHGRSKHKLPWATSSKLAARARRRLDRAVQDTSPSPYTHMPRPQRRKAAPCDIGIGKVQERQSRPQSSLQVRVPAPAPRHTSRSSARPAGAVACPSHRETAPG